MTVITRDVVLIPGLWLDGSSWSLVTPPLEKAGHRAHPVTLPGGAGVTIGDWIAAVTEVIDACPGKVVLVGHSAGSGVASAALDARPDRVARVFYVGGFPALDGRPLIRGFEVTDGVVPLPEFPEFDDADIADLDARARAEFRSRAVPAPGCVVSDPIRLSAPGCHREVPGTAVCPEYTAADLRDWIARGEPGVQGFREIRDLDYADLASGHWPQFTRPEDLANIILARI